MHAINEDGPEQKNISVNGPRKHVNSVRGKLFSIYIFLYIDISEEKGTT